MRVRLGLSPRKSAVLLGLLLAGLAPGRVAAQETEESEPAALGIPLNPSTQRTLVRLQEDWLRWLSSSYRDTGESSESIVDSLMATGEQLSFQRFPDLALGALQQAVRAAHDGESGRAGWILETADRLDPGRPDTLFARSHVDRVGGRLPAAVADELSGYVRLFGDSRLRSLWLGNAVSWAFWVFLLAGAVFVVVVFVAHGPQLYQDLSGLVSGPLPVLAVPVLVPLILLGPLAFPGGWVWMVLIWSALLWAYASATERTVLVLVWLAAVAAPMVLVAQREHQRAAHSPPARALSALEDSRLYGDLFRDFGRLRELVPENTAALQLEADLHQRLGQTRTARSLYRRVLELEPENAAVLVNLGVQYFRQGDFGNSITYFQRAAAADTSRAEPAYNLSQAYSQSFSFEESQSALQDAKNRDNDQVAEWVSDSRSVIEVAGGLERLPEIRAALLEALRTETPDAVGRLGASGIAVALVFALALGWEILRRRLLPGVRFGQSVPTANRWILALVPGAEAAEVGSGFSAFFGVLVPVSLILLPFSRAVGCRLPWGFEPTGLLAATVAIAGLAVLVAWKTWRIVKEGV